MRLVLDKLPASLQESLLQGIFREISETAYAFHIQMLSDACFG